MAITINYDEPINNTLAVDNSSTKLPVESRVFSRDHFSIVSGTILFDGSYPTGGYPTTVAKFGLKVCQLVLFNHQGGYMVVYNQSTDKIQVYQQTTVAGPLIEVPNATNLSTVPAVGYYAHGRQY